jgi:hypothetical protein
MGLFFLTFITFVAVSGSPSHAPRPDASDDPDAVHLPPDITTHHTRALPGRDLRFAATAGSIHLKDGKDAPWTDIAFVAYQNEDAPEASRWGRFRARLSPRRPTLVQCFGRTAGRVVGPVT